MSTLRQLRASSLGVKLALVSAALTAVVVGAAFVLLRARAEAQVERVFAGELEASQRAMHEIQGQTLRLLLETSAVVSTSPTLRAALETRRIEAHADLSARTDLIETIQRAADNIFGELDRDILIVTDTAGRVLAASPRRGAGERDALAVGTSLWHVPAVRYALTTDSAVSDSSFGVLRQGAGGAMQVGCVAIVLGGFPIGALVLGERVGRLMPDSGAALGTRAVLTAGDTVLASTLAQAPPGTRWQGGGRRVRVGTEDFVVAAVPLGLTDGGRPATLYLVRSLSASLGPITRSLGRSFLLAGVLAVLLVGGGAAVIARSTLQPLARFVTFMRAGAEDGSYARFESPQAPAEIATMTDAYNRLIGSLSAQHAQLEERTVQLASALDGLNEEARERERAEQALKESEEQLRQSQKLEALGTLAGGVAHDFNNLLSVILGYSQLSAMGIPADSPLHADLAQISQAADRATGLVRQLLAFSRKQVMQPRIMDLNQSVTGMEQMLRRLISEDVELATRLAPRLARVKADPGQIEQVVMNLVVNARDAMPTGGKITIETANVELDERYEHRPDAISGGPAVMLQVTDTGSGMDAETRRRIFEPFFTTKAPGKGTGLGLSTVYGIVRQSGGSITVYSEPGQGCTFRVYFPVAGDVETETAQAAPDEAATGSETVLVAEDEPSVRALVRRSLAGLGYTVIEGSNGKEALQAAVLHEGPIHLLLTDVVMPHLSGVELAERLRAQRPGLKVLFVSGHSDEAIARHGVLAPGSAFLQKPIKPGQLARVVRDILDSDSPVGVT